MKNTVATFREAKKCNKKITMVTAYDYSISKIVDDSGIDGILVGDSLGMIALGYENTLMVTMEDMIHHIKAVMKGVKNALVIGDMPFMSYQTSTYDAVINAGRLIKEGGCHGVKLEGGGAMAPAIKAIVNAQIPVMGHIGLTPQSVNAFGGFKVQGKDEYNAKRIIEEAKEIEEAGAFAIVLECIPAKLAKIVTEKVSIPTIGIGAGPNCDGQILVYADMFSLFSDMKPKFVKNYGELGASMKEGLKSYIEEVRTGVFPQKEHCFKIEENVIEKLY